MRKRQSANETVDSGGTAATLTRGLEILRAFGVGDDTLGNQDLIDRTGLPKATISRLTSTLIKLGYLHYNEQLGRYSIGPATISLGYNALSSSAVVYMAMPLMQELADSSSVAAALGTRDGSEMVYLATCRSHTPVSLRLGVGSRLPIWNTAMGLSYIIAMRPDPRAELIEHLIDNDPDQANKIRDLVLSAEEFHRQHGFVASFGSWYSYINAVGLAFRPTDGSPLVAITCGGIVDVLSKTTCLEKTGPELIRIVERLRLRLSGDSD